jgi:5'-AMP-activated protein kinase regulatory gamma subunit
VVSAPLWNTDTAKFAGKSAAVCSFPPDDKLTLLGMFTVQDVIHLIQYYYHTSSWEGAAADVEGFRLKSVRGMSILHHYFISRKVADRVDIEKAIQVPPPPLLSVHPLRPLYDACRFLIRTHARRLPLIDKDPQTDGEVVISVLTQYRVLKFIAMNVSILSSALAGFRKESSEADHTVP